MPTGFFFIFMGAVVGLTVIYTRKRCCRTRSRVTARECNRSLTRTPAPKRIITYKVTTLVATPAEMDVSPRDTSFSTQTKPQQSQQPPDHPRTGRQRLLYEDVKHSQGDALPSYNEATAFPPSSAPDQQVCVTKLDTVLLHDT